MFTERRPAHKAYNVDLVYEKGAVRAEFWFKSETEPQRTFRFYELVSRSSRARLVRVMTENAADMLITGDHNSARVSYSADNPRRPFEDYPLLWAIDEVLQ